MLSIRNQFLVRDSIWDVVRSSIIIYIIIYRECPDVRLVWGSLTAITQFATSGPFLKQGAHLALNCVNVYTCTYYNYMGVRGHESDHQH